MSDSATLWTVAHEAPLFVGFSRQEYWNGLPFPSPGDLPDPGIEPVSLTSPALAGRFFTTSATWKVPGDFSAATKRADDSFSLWRTLLWALREFSLLAFLLHLCLLLCLPCLFILLDPSLKLGFSAGSVVRNLPPNGGDWSSIPEPGGSHMLRGNSAHWPQLLSLCSRAWEPQLWSPCAATTEARCPRACAPQ